MKQQVRDHCRDLRQSLGDEEHSHLSRIVCQRAIALLRHCLSRKVASYIPLKGEVSVDTLNSYLMQHNGSLLLPRVENTEEMHFCRFGSEDQLIKGRFGLRQPARNCPVDDQPEVMFVPGMAFDEHLNRIGYGKGYYDRYLERTRHHCLLVGLSLERYVFTDIPAHEHDKKVHMIITETSILGGKTWNSF